MATIKLYMSRRMTNGLSEVYMRLSVCRGKVLRLRTGVYIDPARMRDGEIVMPRSNRGEAADLREARDRLESIIASVLDAVLSDPDIGRTDLERVVEETLHPELVSRRARASFYALWVEYVNGLGEATRDTVMAFGRRLYRYEVHRRMTRDDGYRIDLDSIASGDLEDMEYFCLHEAQLYTEVPPAMIDYPDGLRLESTKQFRRKLGVHSLWAMMQRIRMFFGWARNRGLTDNDPFADYRMETPVLGRPVYLTLEERDKIADWDFGDAPLLMRARDVFVFQCCVGCRYSDLANLKGGDVRGGYLEYVAKKTSHVRGDAIRVPLTPRAAEIAERYRLSDDDPLLPVPIKGRYNERIKEILRICGIDRVVTVIDPQDGKAVRRKVCDIASSHMARRTFVGNLYKRVKDPNLVGSMSGHKPGSTSFARYRDIDDDIKRDVISLLE